MEKVFILANPSSGKKEAEEYAKIAEKTYKEEGIDAIYQLTEKEEDISHLAKMACDERYHTLIILGGDGTVSQAVDAMKDKENKPTIGIIPTGTVNNIARALGISVNLDQAVSDLINGREKTVDAGEVNDRLFLTSVSAGTIPETIWEVPEEQKENYGSFAYLLEGLKALNNEESYTLELEVDGEKQTMDLSLLLIGVSNTIFGISRFFDHAHFDDGKLHLFGLKESTFGEKMTTFSRLLTNEEMLEEEGTAFVLPFEKANIRLKSGETHVALDGDKGPTFPLSVRVLPKFVTFLTPTSPN